MKKLLLLLLLFISVKAFAQFPTPSGVQPFGSALLFYKIVGGDTLVYAKDSHAHWFPIGRSSDLPFTRNFKLLGDTVDLADTIHTKAAIFDRGVGIGTTPPVGNALSIYKNVGPQSLIRM